MINKRYIFTVVAGRSGQGYLTELFNRHVEGCYAAFEEPEIKPILSGPLSHYEKKFRRRFIETHELLGRGKILDAFETHNYNFINKIAKKRLHKINKSLKRNNAKVYIDVSKYFIRGLHIGFTNLLPEISVISLIRDPIKNMRSFLNRNKNFFLDNSHPIKKSNILIMDSKNWEKGEYYLWAWCEVYLRNKRLINNPKIHNHVEIRTELLNDCDFMNSALDKLDLFYTPVQNYKPINTNFDQGYSKTNVKKSDILLFEKFINNMPEQILSEIDYLKDYDPIGALHGNG